MKLGEPATSGTSLAGYNAQLAATEMFYEPGPAVDFVRSEAVMATMRSVADFSFDKGLLGEGASDADFIGMEFPGGKTLGAEGNIKLRFDDTYMKMAADGEL